MATFKQRESGWWQAVIRRRGHPQQSKTFEARREAEGWARQIESEMDRGVFVSANDAERTTLGDLIDRFTKEFAPHHYRKREDEKEAWRFQCERLKDALGAYSLAALDQKLVAKYRDDRLAGKGDRKPVGDSTVRKEIFMLSKVLGFAETECGINLPRGNPVEKIRKPAEGKSRDRRLTGEQLTKLEAECRRSRNHHLWPALQVSLETAMRQGELLALRWEYFDKKRRLAFLPKTKNGEARSVPLTKKAAEVLDALPRHLSGVVFPVERMTLYHAFGAAAKRAKIENFTWHDLRHEALSRLAERGDLNVLELAAMSGHKTLQMLKRYTHLHAEDLAKKLG